MYVCMRALDACMFATVYVDKAFLVCMYVCAYVHVYV
jgi:hypothetical protein